ncbi:hypothetical protein LINGRAHAP2_LOCUS5954 [Linum grandiflorum]
MEFITCIGQGRRSKMLAFSFFRNLVRRNLTLVRPYLHSSSCVLSCHFIAVDVSPFRSAKQENLYSSDLVQSSCLFRGLSDSPYCHILFDTASWSKLSLSRGTTLSYRALDLPGSPLQRVLLNCL